MTNATEFATLHSIFLTILVKDLGAYPPVPESVEEIMNRSGEMASQPVPDEMGAWLDLLDLAISTQRLRNYGLQTRIGNKMIRELLRFYIGRKPHFPADRDKVDWLATYFFRMQEEEGTKSSGWGKTELEEMLEGIPFTALSQDAHTVLNELPPLLQDIGDLRDLRQIMDSRLLDRGRNLKKNVGEEYFHPVVLAAVVNYNLNLRKKFDSLLEKALAEANRMAGGLPTEAPIDEDQLITGDYRSASNALQQLSELTHTLPSEKTKKSESGEKRTPTESSLDQQLTKLGIESDKEEGKLEKRSKEISSHLKAHPSISSVKIVGKTLQLEEWEAVAMRGTTRPRDPFQAEFARAVLHSFSIILRIHEEQYSYENKRALGDEWRKHSNSLFYLLIEGMRHKQQLEKMQLIARKSGYAEIDDRLKFTTEKLQAQISKISSLF